MSQSTKALLKRERDDAKCKRYSVYPSIVRGDTAADVRGDTAAEISAWFDLRN